MRRCEDIGGEACGGAMMTVSAGAVPGVLLLVPEVHTDARGFFLETWNAREFERATGLAPEFVQDNHSSSARGVLRGLHYQVRRPQAKLVYVACGEIYDVALDVRRASRTFGRWTAARLSASNRHMHWIPAGFAHGFLVLSERADVLYKVTDYRCPEHERAIRWNDPALAIDWPLQHPPVLSARDAAAPAFAEAEPVE